MLAFCQVAKNCAWLRSRYALWPAALPIDILMASAPEECRVSLVSPEECEKIELRDHAASSDLPKIISKKMSRGRP